MTRIAIPTITRPDVPNANGVVYSKNVWHKCILDSQNRLINNNILITIDGYSGEYMMHYCRSGFPKSKVIGHTTVLADNYIIADVYDEKKYRKIINMIHRGELKAYMNYIGSIDHCDGDAYRYVDHIHHIVHFALGPAVPGSTCDDLSKLLGK